MRTEFYNVYAPLEGEKITIPVETDYTGKTIVVKVLDKFHKLVIDGPASYSDNKIIYEFTGDEDVEMPATYFVFFEVDGVQIPEADEVVYLLNILNFGETGDKTALDVFLATEINAVSFTS